MFSSAADSTGAGLPHLGGAEHRAAHHDIPATEEIELLLSQKMEAIACVARHVAHELTNALFVVRGHCALALDELDPSSQAAESIELVRLTGERLAKLTGELSAVGQWRLSSATLADPNEVIRANEKRLRSVAGEGIELRIRLDPRAGSVHADRGQLQEVLTQLAVNARQAMPQGGRLTISTRAETLARSYALHRVDARSGPHVLLQVSDTGTGMDEVTRARIFEPFFTTRERGEGRGLGLAVVYGIVRSSGGHITVTGQPDRGSTFRVYFPEAVEGRPADGCAVARASQETPR